MIAVTGLGPVGAFGSGVAAFRAALAGDGPGPAPAGDARHVGDLRADTTALDAFVAARQQRRLDPFSRLALLGAHLALADAGIAAGDHGDLGLVIATGYGPTSTTLAFLDSVFDDGDACASPVRFSHAVHNAAAATLAMRLGIAGPTATIAQFGMSVPAALLTAWQFLTEGRVRRVLFGAVDEHCDLITYCYRRFFGAAGGPADPGDGGRQTAVPGEGALFAVLADPNAAGTAYALVEDLALGAGPVPRPDPPPDLWFTAADGHRRCGRRYAAVLPGGAVVHQVARLTGSLPVGPAFGFAAAALALRDAGRGRAACLTLDGDDGWAWARLRAAGGADA